MEDTTDTISVIDEVLLGDTTDTTTTRKAVVQKTLSFCRTTMPSGVVLLDLAQTMQLSTVSVSVADAVAYYMDHIIAISYTLPQKIDYNIVAFYNNVQ